MVAYRAHPQHHAKPCCMAIECEGCTDLPPTRRALTKVGGRTRSSLARFGHSTLRPRGTNLLTTSQSEKSALGPDGT
eukprot:8000560-Pyramimonas_sp.AAC.1